MALALCLTLLPATALATETEQAHPDHPICGKTCSHTGPGETPHPNAFANAKWLASYNGKLGVEAFQGSDSDESLPTEGNYVILKEGCYYLSTAANGCDHNYVQSNKTIKIQGNVTICLNGKTLQSKAQNNPVFLIEGNGELTLTDCQNGGKVTRVTNSDSQGSGVKVENGGTFNMYGGTITGNKATTGDTATTGNTASQGGGVCVTGASSTFNMYGGAITKNTASHGGGVYVSAGTTFTMNGGTIGGTSDSDANKATNGEKTGTGGGVYVSDGTFTMNGGTISGNTADLTDGGVGVYTATSTTATFTMNGGEITRNSANYGGGVGVYRAATFTMNGSASITDNTANQGGGVYVDDKGVHKGVHMDDATFTMNNTASVSGNTANQGGGVYVESGTFNMNDGTISGNKAKNEKASNDTNGGGVYVNQSGTFNMNGGATSVSNNTADTYGGGVGVYGGTFNMNDGTISDNTAPNGGGGVYASSGQLSTNRGTFNMNNGTISGNKAEANGGGVFVHNNATFTVSKTPTVTGNMNTTNNAASNVHLMGSAYITIGGELTGGEGSIGVTKITGVDSVIATVKKGLTKVLTPEDAAKFKIDETGYEVSVDPKDNKQLVLKMKDIQPPTHSHTYDNWSKDDTHHWHECTARVCTDRPGSIKDRAEHVYDSGADANCNVCGYVRTVTTDPVHVTKITLDPTTATLKVGETTTLNATVKPDNATNKGVTWESSAPQIATVENGKVKALTAGEAKITVKAEDDPNISATCTVTVTQTTTPSQPGGSSSGGSGSYDSNPIIKTETKNNPDGSTTKTETRKDGTVTQTTTGKDGSTGTVKTDKNGKTEMNAKLSAKAVEDAKKSGEPVKVPVEVEASRNSGTAPTVKVELPKNAGKTEVEIPVSNAKPGTVAVLVHADGTEEILKASVPTENGIRLTVDGSATVKIVDNAKDFIDTQNHWAREEINFVSARELVNGMTATRYAPDATATRAQLWTILARQSDANLSGGNTWYEKAQLWSKDKGISDGTNPGATITRARMVTMLWRTMGQPAATDKVSFADVPAGSYYAQAVAWAVESGITAGVGGGRFDPSATCTRAQIAAFLARSMK